MAKKKLSAKPTQAPAFDATAHELALYNSVRKPDGTPYLVFADKALPAWKRWVEASGEFDGKGLRDVVNANALFLDAVKGQVDTVDAREAAHNTATDARLDRLEAAHSYSPFPESS